MGKGYSYMCTDSPEEIRTPFVYVTLVNFPDVVAVSQWKIIDFIELNEGRSEARRSYLRDLSS